MPQPTKQVKGISVHLHKALLDYIQDQPYGEVNHMVTLLEQAPTFALEPDEQLEGTQTEVVQTKKENKKKS